MNKKLSIIVYNQRVPSYFQINQALLKKLLFIIPFVFTITLLSLFGYNFYLKAQLSSLQQNEPEAIQLLRQEINLLEQKNLELNERNLNLEKKVSFGGDSSKSAQLELIKSPLSMKDLRHKKKIEIESPVTKLTTNTVSLSFNLKNIYPEDESTISGYITVVQYQSNTFEFYPKYDVADKSIFLQYNKGESFSISRFRPFKADFRLYDDSPLRYKVFIFNKEGDLLYYSELGPFQASII